MTVWFVHLSPENVGTLLVAVLVSALGWRVDRRNKRIEIIVNGRYDTLAARTVQLETAMRELGHEPPPDPSVAPVGQGE